MRILAIVLVVGLVLSGDVSAEKLLKPFCYSAVRQKQIKRALAELKGARKKILARDKAIASLRKRIAAFVRRENLRVLRVARIDMELIGLRGQRKKSEVMINRLLVGGAVLVGVVVVSAGAVGVAYAVHAPP